MKLTDLRVAYWPYSSECSGPGDRRRFVFYAKEKNIKYEIACNDKEYDLVYLTVGCNIYEWIKYKKKYPKVKMVFEIVDSYFFEGLDFFTAASGITKFLMGKESKLYMDYRKAIKKMLHTVDAIICSTPIQKDFLVNYNENVHISLDFFEEDITHKKTNYSLGKKLKLVWEGQTYTAHNLLYLKDVLKSISEKIELHIITDPVIKFPFKIFNRKTATMLSSLQCEYYLHDWNKETFSKIIADMDMAIIPLNGKRYGITTMNKPENKLLLFWQIGIPVLTSESPAYKRVMDKVGLQFYCKTKEDWAKKILDFINSSEDCKIANMNKAAQYLHKYHSKEVIIEHWDNIFSSLHF
ncbi:hypothetical protein BH11BAC3_BH11BAC3_01220 [soil metagenome]